MTDPAHPDGERSAIAGGAPSAQPGIEAGPGLSASSILSPLEAVALHEVLRGVSARLAAVETAIHAHPPPTRPLLDTARLLVGGWPAFGFVFLLLFYVPLRDVLQAIPEKIRSADEIALPGGVSLKSTIEKVAAAQGLAGLAKTIPELSNDAVSLLLRAPRRNGSEGLISYSSDSSADTHYTAIQFPSDATVAALRELVARGFVKIEEGAGRGQAGRVIDGQRLEAALQDIKRRFPGRVERTGRDERITWLLDAPLSRGTSVGDLMWSLTESGEQAVGVVLQAISAELARGDAG